ncbi:hypothetical protein C8R46DRAFT_1005310 [Mycena filopes]|nr:hypothetical protein C8R46DRAFT_1005310 [Mycena filopes]
MAHSPAYALYSANLEPSHTVQRENVARIHFEIAKCERELAALKEELVAAEESLDRIIYPVLTLPNEITSKIFVVCLPSHGRVRPCPQTAPLVLAQVCGHWRDVALSTSELWCSVDLDSRSPGSSRVLEAWLSRAKRCPLSLTFRDGIGRQNSLLIRSLADQIARLELNITPAGLRSLQPLRSLPRLRSLAIIQPIDVTQELVKIAPALTELRLLAHCHILPQFFTSSITTLEIAFILSGQELCMILNKLHVLADLKCTVDDWDVDETDGLPVILPHLRSLHLDSSLLLIPMDVLADLTLPNLRILKPTGAMLPSILRKFIERSTCTLSELYIDDIDLAPKDLAHLSQDLVSIVRLEIAIYDRERYFSGSRRGFASILDWISSHHTVWPLCTHLVLITGDLTDECLLHLLVFFCIHAQIGMAFEFHTADSMDLVAVPKGRYEAEFRMLLAEGLQFTIKYSDGYWPPEYSPDPCAHFPHKRWA